MDQKNRLALIHNGVIENSQELKDNLIENGVKFKSETDTEVIAQQIGFFMDNGSNFLESLQKTLEVLRGTWGTL
jgi:glutamine---fructose-6-phosphate transaminase (isomerizing)